MKVCNQQVCIMCNNLCTLIIFKNLNPKLYISTVKGILSIYLNALLVTYKHNIYSFYV